MTSGLCAGYHRRHPPVIYGCLKIIEGSKDDRILNNFFAATDLRVVRRTRTRRGVAQRNSVPRPLPSHMELDVCYPINTDQYCLPATLLYLGDLSPITSRASLSPFSPVSIRVSQTSKCISSPSQCAFLVIRLRILASSVVQISWSQVIGFAVIQYV
jgi:hypothetical protein